MCVSVGDSSRVLLRQYRIRLKKTGTKVELPASLLHRFVRGGVDAVNVCNPSCSPLQSTQKAIPPAAANTVPATASLCVCLGDVILVRGEDAARHADDEKPIQTVIPVRRASARCGRKLALSDACSYPPVPPHTRAISRILPWLACVYNNFTTAGCSNSRTHPLQRSNPEACLAFEESSRCACAAAAASGAGRDGAAGRPGHPAAAGGAPRPGRGGSPPPPHLRQEGAPPPAATAADPVPPQFDASD